MDYFEKLLKVLKCSEPGTVFKFAMLVHERIKTTHQWRQHEFHLQRRTLINTKNLFTWKVFFGQAHFNDYLNDAVTHKDILGAKYLMNSINESLRFVDVDRPVFYVVGFF